jgi:hypothetical protein
MWSESLQLFSLVHGIIFVLAVQIFAFRDNLLTKSLACGSLVAPQWSSSQDEQEAYHPA